MRSLCLKLSLVAFASVFVGPALGWTSTADITNGASYEVGPRAVHDSLNNIYMVWYGGNDNTALWQVYYQKYNGTSWTAAVSISGTNAAYADIAVDGSNNLHAVWHAGGNPEEVYYRRCTAGTWGTTVNLSSSATRSLNPRVAADSTGNNVVVAWHEDGQNGANWDIVAKKCTGGTWGALENVSADTTLSRNADVAVDSGANFHIAWEDTDTKNMFYRKRNSNGTYGTKTALDTTAGRSYNSAVAVSANDFVHVAWHDDNNADWDIAYRYFNGTSWSSVVNVSNNPGVTDGYATIDTDSNNQVYILWHDFANIYYTHTVGGVWRPWYLVSPGTAQQTGTMLINGDGQKYAFWQSRDPGTWDVMWTHEAIVDSTPPGAVTGLTATATDRQVKLAWNNPSDIDFKSTMLRYKTTGYPTGPTDGTLVIDRPNTPGSSDSYVHSALTNGTTYYYAAYSYDTEPNYAAAANASGLPVAGAKPNLLANPFLDGFTGGVATSWTSYKVNDPNNAISLASDSTYFISAPDQLIQGIDGGTFPASGLTAAGIQQVVSGLTVGKVYQFVASQDIYNTNFGAAGHRYLLNFGVNGTGGTSPGTPTTDGSIGGCKWMTSSQAFWNNTTGSSVFYFGYHRSTAAFPATATSVSVWSGLTLDNAAAKDSVSTKFYTDQAYLFEWDTPANAGLQNGGFEGTRIDLQDGGDVIPTSWVPAGGGVGQSNVWTNDTFSLHSGSYGMQIANRRGTVNAGLLQKIACTSGLSQTFSAWAKASGQDGTTAAIGIDPTGGVDILSGSIVWVTSTASTYTQLTVNATASASAITVFVKTMNNNTAGGNYHYSYFDECAWSQSGPPGTIAGTITDECGAVVSGATVSTTTGGYTTTTAANGTYTLSNVVPATYTVQAAKTGYNTASTAGVVVTSGNTSTVNMTLVASAKGTISGTITDNCGAAISGATVSTTTGCYSTTTAANGTYTLANVPAGTYTVQSVKTGYTTASQSNVSVTGGGTTTVNLTMTPSSLGTISGTITDACGAAISGATVSTTTGCYSTTTAANGTYTLSNVPAATYTVQSVKSGYTTASQANVVVTNGGTTTVNLTMPFASVGTISGTVTDGCGAAISGGTVSTTTGCWSTTTAANGTYTLSNVAAGTYTVQFVKSGFTTATTTGVVVTGGGTTTVNKTLVASALGTISGTITDACGVVISSATVSTTTGCYSTTTAANGTYTLSNVPAGTYTVQSVKSGYTTTSQANVVVTGGGTTTVNLTMPFASVGTISGTVTASGGGAISGATVSTTTGCWSATTAANGTYTLSSVATGTYTVQAVKSGYNTGTQSGVVVTNGATTTVNFTLTPNAPFEHMSNGNMEGGFFATGWATTCSGQTSKLPNPSGTWGWNEDATYPFNTYDKTSIVHGGTHSLGFAFCQTAGDPGKLGISYQSVNLGTPNATGTFSCWGYNTNGNCPSIMCWNPGNNQTDPYVANSGGRLLWICGAGNNWTTLNTWQTNSMTVTADSSGYVTIMVGGAAWAGTSSGAPLYIDDVSVMAP